MDLVEKRAKNQIECYTFYKDVIFIYPQQAA